MKLQESIDGPRSSVIFRVNYTSSSHFQSPSSDFLKAIQKFVERDFVITRICLNFDFTKASKFTIKMREYDYLP